MTRHQRPLSAVPKWVWALLVTGFAAQIALVTQTPARVGASVDLPRAPRPEILRIAGFGEPEALARLAMLYIQSYDLGGVNTLPYRRLDYGRLMGWLNAVLDLDSRSTYPLFAASRIYAENPDPARARQALAFVYNAFFSDPNRRWPFLAHAAFLAKHRLNDLPLARRYAAAVERHTSDPTVPLWARQMEVFILEDMGELETAKIMLGGLLESGAVRDPAEAGLLLERLKHLEERLSRGN